MIDLFGKESELAVKELAPKRNRAHPAPVGSGPKGETCRGCGLCNAIEHRGKRYYKCGHHLVSPTHGEATDLRLKDSACSFWLNRQNKEMIVRYSE